MACDSQSGLRNILAVLGFCASLYFGFAQLELSKQALANSSAQPHYSPAQVEQPTSYPNQDWAHADREQIRNPQTQDSSASTSERKDWTRTDEEGRLESNRDSTAFPDKMMGGGNADIPEYGSSNMLSFTEQFRN